MSQWVLDGGVKIVLREVRVVGSSDNGGTICFYSEVFIILEMEVKVGFLWDLVVVILLVGFCVLNDQERWRLSRRGFSMWWNSWREEWGTARMKRRGFLIGLWSSVDEPREGEFSF